MKNQTYTLIFHGKGYKMSDERPKFPNCIMTPEIIRVIRAKQEAWDKEHENEEEK